MTMAGTSVPRSRTTDPAPLDHGAAAQRKRLLALRAQLLAEQVDASSPAVARALEMADAYLFLALGYTGHTDELFPGEQARPVSQ